MKTVEPVTTDTSLIDLADDLATDHADLMDALVHLRKAKGLTQEEVGKRMGVSQATVCELEREESNPTLLRVRRYAQAVRARFTTTVVDAE